MALDPVSLGVGVVSNLIGGISKASAQRKKDRAEAERVKGQQAAQQQATNRVNDTVDVLGASRPDIRGTAAQFVNQLRTGSVARPSALPTASRQFRNDVNASNIAGRQYGTTMADLFARLRAPMQQRQAESIEFSHAGDDIARIKGDAQSTDFLAQMKSNAVQENPWVSLLTGGLDNYAKARAGSRVSKPPTGINGPVAPADVWKLGPVGFGGDT